MQMITTTPTIQPADMSRRQLTLMVLILGALTAAFISMSIDVPEKEF